MADGTYDAGLEALATGDWAGDDIRVLALVDDVSLDFDRTHATITAVLAPAGNTEADGAGYARKVVPARTATIVAGNKLALDHDDLVYTEVDAGVFGALVYYLEGATDGDRIPLFYKDSGFPFTTNGTDLTVSTPAEGLVDIADAV